MTPFLLLRAWLEARLEAAALRWLRSASAEIADGLPDARFAALIALASRHAGRAPLALGEEELGAAERALEGWNPERWTRLEALRSALLLSRSDLAEESCALAVEQVFQFADEGEQCALYRALALLPGPQRFLWRAGEGCRSNMRSVFEAVALDTPYPARFFEDLAWRQVVIKALFIGAPLWRLWGLDQRLSPELARMALDLADERRSAGRPVPHELWLALGSHGGARALEALERELAPDNPNRPGRRAAVYALARAGDTGRLAALARVEQDPVVRADFERARAGPSPASSFRQFAP
jgi:hypothetical protein